MRHLARSKATGVRGALRSSQCLQFRMSAAACAAAADGFSPSVYSSHLERLLAWHENNCMWFCHTLAVSVTLKLSSGHPHWSRSRHAERRHNTSISHGLTANARRGVVSGVARRVGPASPRMSYLSSAPVGVCDCSARGAVRLRARSHHPMNESTGMPWGGMKARGRLAPCVVCLSKSVAQLLDAHSQLKTG